MSREHPTQPTSPRLLISEAGMRVMRRLVGRPPQDMADLIRALNVTRTAVTEQLAELIAMDYVEQTQAPSRGRGRPRYLFSATELAMRRLFEGYQDIVVPAMWRSIRKHFGDEAITTICLEVAEEISLSYLRQIQSRTARGRMREFADILTRNDRLVEIYEKKHFIEMRKFNCPFISMSDETGTLCYIDHLCMQLIIGNGQRAPLKLTASRNEGHPCCTFHLDMRLQTEQAFINVGLDI